MLNNISVQHFQNLVVIAAADGVFEESEKEFLLEKGLEAGIDTATAIKIISEAGDLVFSIPTDPQEKINQLKDAVALSRIDGNMAEVEYNLCLQFAEKMGFTKTDLDYIIQINT